MGKTYRKEWQHLVSTHGTTTYSYFARI